MPAPPPDIGSRVGPYELLASVGSGGMARVYLARASGPGTLRKLVALKLVHGHLMEDQEILRMFVDEATLSARICHPNACSVIDFGNADGTWYIAMEYLEGASLSTLLRATARHIAAHPEDRRLVMACVCRAVADACQGIHAAHEAEDEQGRPLEVVHRDVSPDNLFVTVGGPSKIVDFGIAAGRGRLQQTSVGVTKGKPSYLAPEMLDEGPLDRRVDVWALGVVLWEALCMQRLFRCDAPDQTVAAVLSRPIPRPSHACEAVPPALDRPVMRALERSLTRRWPTAQAFGDALSAACQEEGLVATDGDVGVWIDRVLPGLRQVLGDELARALATKDPTTAGIVLPEAARVPDDGEELTDPLPSTAIFSLPDGSAREEDVEDEEHTRRGPVFWVIVAFAMVLVGAMSYWLTGAPWRARASDAPVQVAETMPLGGGALPVVTATSDGAAPCPNGRDGGGSMDATVSAADGSRPDLAVSPVDGSPPDAAATIATDGATPSEVGREEPHVLRRGRGRGRGTAGAPRDATARFGEVRVATPGGWAAVYHRGRRIAPHTPATVRLPAGRQVVELRFEGERSPRRAVVTVQPGRAVPLVVRAPR